MAKKEFVKITPEGLNLISVINYSSICENGGLYNREIFFTDGFKGNTQFVFQCFGNIGAHPRSTSLDKDISYIIIGDKLIELFENGQEVDFIIDLEKRLNQNNSPYRKMKFLSEEQIVWYFENRAKANNDEMLNDLITRYKSSKKEVIQQNLF
jgi:hypothetical protein